MVETYIKYNINVKQIRKPKLQLNNSFAINYSIATLQRFCRINCSIMNAYLKIYPSVEKQHTIILSITWYYVTPVRLLCYCFVSYQSLMACISINIWVVFYPYNWQHREYRNITSGIPISWYFVWWFGAPLRDSHGPHGSRGCRKIVAYMVCVCTVAAVRRPK